VNPRVAQASEYTGRVEDDSLTGQLEAVAALWKREKRELRVRFGGASMMPTIAPGSEVLLRCGLGPAPGEIAAFMLGNRLIVHRVIARSPAGTWVLTRGDASAIPDPPIRETAVIGTVVRVWHGDRFVAPLPPPASPGRRLALSVSLLGLGVTPLVGRRVIALLWFLRRWLVLAPRATARRIQSAIGGSAR
jgi:Peptidase S24-like